MKLLLVLASPRRAGAEENLLRLAAALVGRGWSVAAALPDAAGADSLAADLAAAGVAVHRLDVAEHYVLNVRTGLRAAAKVLRVAALVRRTRPDAALVLVPYPQFNLWGILGCALAGVRAGVRFALADQPKPCGPARARLYRWARRRGQTWYAVSAQNRPAVAASYRMPVEEVGLIYNGVAPPDAEPARRTRRRAEVRRELGLDPAARLALTVGRVCAAKGCDELLHAAAAAIRERPDLHFLWAGGEEDGGAFAARIREYGLAGRLRLLGPRRDVDRLLDAADLFVFPTRAEGCSNALLEAMAAGTPVVASDASSNPELIADGVHGRLFRAGDACALLDALRRALDHPEAMTAMAARAAERAATRFAFDRMLRETAALLGAPPDGAETE